MSKQTVNLGSSVNDGTGDSIRVGFSKLNDNFTEVYSAFPTINTTSNVVTVSNTMWYGNSSVNAASNSTLIYIANSTSNVNLTSAQVFVGNSSVNTKIGTSFVYVGSNAIANTSTVKINAAVGNSSVNATMIQVQNSSSVANLTASGLTIGTAVVNSSVIKTESANLSTNTLTLGTSSIAANGYSRMPNGLLMQWGAVSSNATIGNITFPTSFSTLYIVQFTVETTTHGASYLPVLIASNTTTANVRTGNTATKNVYYMALGV
jgi:hypothetical protein